jgi:hypothetical protein
MHRINPVLLKGLDEGTVSDDAHPYAGAAAMPEKSVYLEIEETNNRSVSPKTSSYGENFNSKGKGNGQRVEEVG